MLSSKDIQNESEGNLNIVLSDSSIAKIERNGFLYSVKTPRFKLSKVKMDTIKTKLKNPVL